MSKSIDFLIVGQGLAGSVLAMELERRGLSYLVMDGYREPSSTAVAAGLVNPITGRNFVKSWKVDEFLPFAKSFYRSLEEFLNHSLYHEIVIKRYFSSSKEVNDWTMLQSDPVYADYIGEILKESNDQIIAPFGYGIIKQGAWLNCVEFLNAVSAFLKHQDKIIVHLFDLNRLDINSSKYGDINFKNIVFCEGYRRILNHLFEFVPPTFAKGEVLIVKCRDLNSLEVLNKNFFVLPLGNHLYKIGATFSWEECNLKKSAEAKENLLSKFKTLVNSKFEVIDHLVGIRPTSKDRKPILGVHPQHRNVSIFNGLGTKGVSMAPLCAAQLCDELIDGNRVEKDLSLDRFF